MPGGGGGATLEHIYTLNTHVIIISTHILNYTCVLTNTVFIQCFSKARLSMIAVLPSSNSLCTVFISSTPLRASITFHLVALSRLGEEPKLEPRRALRRAPSGAQYSVICL